MDCDVTTATQSEIPQATRHELLCVAHINYRTGHSILWFYWPNKAIKKVSPFGCGLLRTTVWT